MDRQGRAAVGVAHLEEYPMPAGSEVAGRSLMPAMDLAEGAEAVAAQATLVHKGPAVLAEIMVAAALEAGSEPPVFTVRAALVQMALSLSLTLR